MKKVSIKTINRIPRLLIRYRSYSTNRQLLWKYLIIPSRPKTLFIFVRNIILGDSTIYKDELGILLSHDLIYRHDDIILAVGVGSGISLIHNCMKPRVNSAFIGIEGSQEQIDVSIENSRLNGIDPLKFELIEGYAGNPDHLYGEQNQHTSEIIDINKFNFDILELDCEGSEIEILHNLIVRPRHIIVEMHPVFRDINIGHFLSEMKHKGYLLVKIFTVNGDLVEIDNIDSYFSIEIVKRMTSMKLDWGDNLLVLNFTLFQ